ncbi:inactive LRR receptor-like serine/threonine-protein kinase BIR2 [Amaranthus tricolor]|uniref:inactive LRR receptor-like serine/threonine-protein kinase BIR2 n=1 Tax=Amaranthus tricolor TaxID=29722 RepID=UPI0025827CFE|nr:inactive LRR receptor-like serine/threonine-protein kinase BIR2 [Amaranthus tricolor]
MALAGNIPEELNNFIEVQVLLDLSNNNISGPIPQDLVKLINLETLNLSHNHLSGKVPSSFSNMKSKHRSKQMEKTQDNRHELSKAPETQRNQNKASEDKDSCYEHHRHTP